MATEVTLPQLGESVTEGTVTAWLVEVGDTVEADQPLFELSSDKIDTEVPAPASGVLTEIKVGVDETVDVGTVVAIIGDADEADADAGAVTDTEADDGGETDTEAGGGSETDTEAEGGGETEAEAPSDADGDGDGDDGGARREATRVGVVASTDSQGAAGNGGQPGAEVLMSPLVRRLVAEHDLDPAQLSGSGQGGRITRDDVQAAIAASERTQQPASAAPGRAAPSGTAARERTEKLSRVRQRIAEKMMESLASSAQLTTVQEADVTGIMRLRAKVKDRFKEREGVSLSPFVFMARAAVLALRDHPAVNAKADWEAGQVTYRDYVNLGIAVDTEKGLMVPNVKGADELTLAGLARGIVDAAEKARGVRSLEMRDIEGGTFTVTNTGSRGVLIDTPILNHPEVAILGTGAIKRRPVVVSTDDGESIGVRDMVYLCMTYDHRLIDGADAARYVTDVAQILQTHDWAAEVG